MNYPNYSAGHLWLRHDFHCPVIKGPGGGQDVTLRIKNPAGIRLKALIGDFGDIRLDGCFAGEDVELAGETGYSDWSVADNLAVDLDECARTVKWFDTQA